MNSLEKKLTPLKIIRRYCLWCCCEQPNEVRLCTKGYAAKLMCRFYPYRLGKKCGKPKRKDIKLRCLDCTGFIPSGVRECERVGCDLWLYKNGKKTMLPKKAPVLGFFAGEAVKQGVGMNSMPSQTKTIRTGGSLA